VGQELLRSGDERRKVSAPTPAQTEDPAHSQTPTLNLKVFTYTQQYHQMILFDFNESNTFCISLESHKKRWENMQRRFAAQNLKVTRWLASTPKTLTDNFASYLNDFEKACTQSHINIWKHVVTNKLDYAFVFEDDACFDKTWREKLNANTIVDTEWDIILLNASEPERPLHMWKRVTEQFMLASYIISYKGAQTLLNSYHGEFAMSDWMTSRIQYNGHTYSYFPWLVIQEGADSTLKDPKSEHLQADREKVVRLLKEIDYSLDNYDV
jgi:GR25 family glycosyltransferase involved in LPS biosynthesis